MKKYNFIIAIILIVFIRCESPIQNFKIKEVDPKLVLHAFLGADSIPKVAVTKNQKLAQDVKLHYQINSEVEVYHADELLTTLALNEETNWFENSGFTFEENRNYTIKAHNEGFPDVEASFYIPEKPDIISVDTQFFMARSADCIDCEPVPSIQFRIKFNNPVANGDYYSVEVIKGAFEVINKYSEFGVIENTDTAFVKKWIYISSNAPFIQTEYDGWYYNLQQPESAWAYKFFFSDALLKDGENEIVFNTALDSMTYNSVVEDSTEFLTVKFRKIDKYLFNYVQSKGKNYDADDNPFVEPVSIYTNVENGLGIVAGFSEYSKTFDISDLDSKQNTEEN